jgi:hypothetical protein
MFRGVWKTAGFLSMSIMSDEGKAWDYGGSVAN